MDSMNVIVGVNIRQLREKNGFSLEELSKLSGVSKSMLAIVERGDGNPSLTTLWKIANGMKVPFDALTARPEKPYEIVKTADIQPLLEDNGRVKNYSLFPDDGKRGFAVYYLELEKGSYWKSEPHLKGTTELITLFTGSIEICVNQQQLIINAGESIRFFADHDHSYKNIGEETAILHMILRNP